MVNEYFIHDGEICTSNYEGELVKLTNEEVLEKLMSVGELEKKVNVQQSLIRKIDHMDYEIFLRKEKLEKEGKLLLRLFTEYFTKEIVHLLDELDASRDSEVKKDYQKMVKLMELIDKCLLKDDINYIIEYIVAYKECCDIFGLSYYDD